VSAAIFGLIGVVVGALVTGGVDYVMQRRREKAELRQARPPQARAEAVRRDPGRYRQGLREPGV